MDSTDQQQHRVAGRYLLLAPLGRGGMGTVWAARDEVLGRDVAIKQIALPATPDQAEFRERSLREVRAAAQIASPHAVQVFDVVEEAGQPWIVMQLVHGPTLAEVLSAGPLPPAQVVQIAQHVLAALSAAHERGVLHRDVKPSNVLLRNDGAAVLGDFGISQLYGDPALTAVGAVVGSVDYSTPDYQAPERVLGGAATPATDLWALGCLMYAALTGRRAFARGDAMSTMQAIQHEDPVLPPGPLAPVLRGLLAKKPVLRISAETARLMLLAAAAGSTPFALGPVRLAAPVGVPARTPAPAFVPSEAVPPGRPSKRRGRRLVAVAAAVVLVAGGVATAAAAVTDRGPDDQQVTSQGDEPAASSGVPEPGPPTPEPAAPTTSAPSESEPPDTGPFDTEPDVPAGYRLHVDPSGFSVAVPQTWTVSRDGSRTDFSEPGGDRFLRIDQTQTPKPDPVADWQDQEAGVADRLGGYDRITIEPVVYRDYDAADWEFTWQTDSGPLHVLNRNTITGPDRAYALYWSTPDSQWEDSRALFDTFAQTFQPAA